MSWSASNGTETLEREFYATGQIASEKFNGPTERWWRRFTYDDDERLQSEQTGGSTRTYEYAPDGALLPHMPVDRDEHGRQTRRGMQQLRYRADDQVGSLGSDISFAYDEHGIRRGLIRGNTARLRGVGIDTASEKVFIPLDIEGIRYAALDLEAGAILLPRFGFRGEVISKSRGGYGDGGREGRLERAFGPSGGYWEASLGCWRLGVRDYDPATRQFAVPDPLSILDLPEYYELRHAAYPKAVFRGDPINYVDPTGASDEAVVGFEVTEIYVYRTESEGEVDRGPTGSDIGFVDRVVEGAAWLKENYDAWWAATAAFDRRMYGRDMTEESARARDQISMVMAASGVASVAGSGRITKLFYDSRAFRKISRAYWKEAGGAGGRSLHHWLFPQSAKWVPVGLRNAGFNVIELPAFQGVFHPTLGLNQWMGFAKNWGYASALQAGTVEWSIRLGIPATAAAVGYGSYRLTDSAPRN